MTTETRNTGTRVDKLDEIARIIAKLDDASVDALEEFATRVLAAQQEGSDGK